jgi:hypothetical protein
MPAASGHMQPVMQHLQCVCHIRQLSCVVQVNPWPLAVRTPLAPNTHVMMASEVWPWRAPGGDVVLAPQGGSRRAAVGQVDARG